MNVANSVTKALGPEQKRLFERIAILLIHDVQQESVAEAVNLTPGAITQIKADPRFIDIFENEKGRIEKNKEEIEEINDNWDALEKKSLSRLRQLVDVNGDPDLMLRIAAVSNKALRRGRGNQPIQASMGGAVNLSFNQVYVDKLNGNGNGNENNHDGGMRVINQDEYSEPIKEVDLPMPHVIEQLLTAEKKVKDKKKVEIQESVTVQIDAGFDQLIAAEKEKRNS